jgi:hypothetical protein
MGTHAKILQCYDMRPHPPAMSKATLSLTPNLTQLHYEFHVELSWFPDFLDAERFGLALVQV